MDQKDRVFTPAFVANLFLIAGTVFYRHICAVVTERELFSFFNARYERSEVFVTERSIIDFGEYAAQIAQQGHMTHVHGMENSLPIGASRAHGFPSFLII